MDHSRYSSMPSGRDESLTPKNKLIKALVSISVLIMFVSAVPTGALYWMAWNNEKFYKTAIATEGVIVDIDTTRVERVTKDDNGREKVTTETLYTSKLEFKSVDGRTGVKYLERERPVYKENQIISLYYNPADLRNIRIGTTGQNYEKMFEWAGIGAMLFFGSFVCSLLLRILFPQYFKDINYRVRPSFLTNRKTRR